LIVRPSSPAHLRFIPPKGKHESHGLCSTNRPARCSIVKAPSTTMPVQDGKDIGSRLLQCREGMRPYRHRAILCCQSH
jgi:hypothetical protein